MNEPLWRTILNWGAVITFFGLPVILFLSQVTWLKWEQHGGEFKWLGEFFGSVTVLVFGLAGLNSWDKRLNGNGNQKKPKEENGEVAKTGLAE